MTRRSRAFSLTIAFLFTVATEAASGPSQADFPSFGDPAYAVKWAPLPEMASNIQVAPASYLIDFKQEVTDLYREEFGANFAGAYVLVQWHAGTSFWAQ